MSVFGLYNPVRRTTYFATRLLGRGGQAAVWEGYYNTYGIDMPVAIKVIGLATDPQAWDAWNLQQRIHLQCIGQPHIIQSIDQFTSSPDHNGNQYLVLVMERAEGSAAEIVDRGAQLSPIDVCALGWQLGLALEFLDSIRVYHRDVTLRNVLRCANGIYKLCDFGISRADVSPEQVAQTRRGTPGFVAPEHVMGHDVRSQSDIYQLGMVLLSLLIGRHPIPVGLNEEEVKQAILEGVPRQTAERVIPIYGSVAEIIYWMVARTLSKRFQNATQVRLAFETEYRKLKVQTIAATAQQSRTQAANGFADFRSKILPSPQIASVAQQGVKQSSRNALAALRSPNAKPNPILNGLLDFPPSRGNPRPQQALQRDMSKYPILSKILASPPKLGRALARSVSPHPAQNGLILDRPLVDSPQLQGVAREPNQNAAIGGLFGLGALAALAAGEKPLAGALGLGALAALASNPSAKSSS